MSVRTYLGNTLIGLGRSIGRKEGASELAVTVSDHSIKARMVDISEKEMAWDHDLYRHGNLFYQSYANPVKIKVNHNPGLDNKDTVGLQEGDASVQQGHEDDGDGSDPLVEGDADYSSQERTADESEQHKEVMSSNRYQMLAKQNIISQMVNPQEQWRILMYLIIGTLITAFISVIMSASAAGFL